MSDMSMNQRSAGARPAHSTIDLPHRGSSKRWAMYVVTIVVILVVIGGGAFLWMKHRNTGARGIKTNQYQAVFLTNNQVYFGHITSIDGSTIRLQNIYYLTPNQTTQSGTQAQTNQQLSLVKLGQEIHGPEDVMFIDRHQVLFWENLTDGGKVVQAIKSQK